MSSEVYISSNAKEPISSQAIHLDVDKGFLAYPVTKAICQLSQRAEAMLPHGCQLEPWKSCHHENKDHEVLP